MKPPEPGRGPRVRRGDVRTAILDVLAAARSGDPVNGYQVIQHITERSGGEWRPSPGSVYPTIQQLHDEGLVESDDERGRKTLRLTAAGVTYVEEHAEDLAAVWRPFERERRRADRAGRGETFADIEPEIGQVMGAVWQILSQGSDAQRSAAVDVLVDARRRLYGILADGHDLTEADPDESGEADGPETGRADAGATCGSGTPSASRPPPNWASATRRAGSTTPSTPSASTGSGRPAPRPTSRPCSATCPAASGASVHADVRRPWRHPRRLPAAAGSRSCRCSCSCSWSRC